MSSTYRFRARSGGGQLQPDLVGKIDAAVANARLNTGNGMTETCGIITSIGGHFFIDRPESAGRATPVYEVKVADDDGNSLPVGQEPSVMASAVASGRLE